MAKNSNIRWRKKDIERVRKTAQRFNAKITRLEKKNPEFSRFYPERISTKELQSIPTRKEFNRIIKGYEKFLEKGSEKLRFSEKGYGLTDWEIKETQQNVRRVNRQNAIKKERIKPSTEKGTMGLVEKNNLKSYSTNFDKRTFEEFRKFERFLEKNLSSKYRNEKANLYKQNYINAIDQNLGNHPYGKILKDLINELDIDTLLDGAADSPQLQIQFISLPSNDYNIIAEETLSHWLDFLNRNGIETEAMRGL
uniref:Terminal protein n=1 Tax=Podoviridae sp. ctC8s18 TaxID=2827617 RepID=A0A8S5LQM6_9CAUD|nr:MAG TPA: terminal protein [Podoviridae sp. ctC8s18]